jgi:Glycosyl hydrolases family 16/IPT/TIG domain
MRHALWTNVAQYTAVQPTSTQFLSDLDHAVTLGMVGIRIDIVPGYTNMGLDLSQPTAKINAAKSRGLKVLAMLPHWEASKAQVHDYTGLKAFAGRVVAALGSKIDVIEMGNEPNYTAFTGGQAPDPVFQANVTMAFMDGGLGTWGGWLITPGLAPVDGGGNITISPWTDAYWAALGASYKTRINGAGVHLYSPPNPSNSAYYKSWAMLDHLHAVTGKPIFVTEMNDIQDTGTAQANNFQLALNTLSARPDVSDATLYEMSNQNSETGYGVYGTGGNAALATVLVNWNQVVITPPPTIPYPIGFAPGAGLPKFVGAVSPEMDAYKAAGAKFFRPSIEWDSGSTGVNGMFDKTAATDQVIAYANQIGLDVLLTVGFGPTHNGVMSDAQTPGCLALFATFCANVIARYNGTTRASGKYVLAIEIGNEPNHDKMTTIAAALKGPNYAELLIRLFGPTSQGFEQVRSRTTRPVIIGGLGGEGSAGNDQTSYLFTQQMHGTFTVDGHSITLGLLTHYDGWNDHTYTYPTLPSQDTSRGAFNLNQIMAWFQSTFGAKPPVWISEVGDPTNPETDATCQAAANLLTDLVNWLGGHIKNDGWQIKCLAWFDFMNNNKTGLPSTANDNFFGIVDYNTDPSVAVHKPHIYDTYLWWAAQSAAPPPGIPIVSSVSPTSGPAAGLTPITITGAYLTGASVKIGGVACSSVVVVSDTSVTAMTPPHAAGVAGLVVTTPVGTSNSVNYQYLSGVGAVPAVTSVTPNHGPAAGGTTLSVIGSGFTALASADPMPTGDVTSGGHTWHPVFSEDFNTPIALGSFVNNANWTVYGPYVDPGGNAFYSAPKVLSVHDGEADFWFHTESGVHYLATIMTTFSQLYGRYTFRMKVVDVMPGYHVTPLLWPDSGVWPRDGEVDFPDVWLDNSGATVNAFMHHQGATSGGDQDFFPSGVTPYDWHTYTMEWSAATVKFYIDGTLFGTSTTRIPNTSMHWVLQFDSDPAHGAIADATQGHVLIDWAVGYSY